MAVADGQSASGTGVVTAPLWVDPLTLSAALNDALPTASFPVGVLSLLMEYCAQLRVLLSRDDGVLGTHFHVVDVWNRTILNSFSIAASSLTEPRVTVVPERRALAFVRRRRPPE